MNLKQEQKIILAAQAEPRKHYYDEEGNIKSEMIYGGLTTALEPFMLEHNGVWIAIGRGEADFDERVFDNDNYLWVSDKEEKNNYKLVRISNRENGEISQDYINFYYKVSNGEIWPICHSLPEYAELDDQKAPWRGYVRYNKKFSEEILNQYNEGDMIIGNDYHLFLASDMIRKKEQDSNIILFNHIPIPEPDMFKKLSHAEDFWKGICGADLFGVQTPEDVENVLDIADSLNLKVNREKQIYESAHHGKVKVGAYPIGIRFDHFQNLDTENYTEDIKEEWGEDLGEFVIYGVDRIDYSKGLPEKVKALIKLFEENEKLRGKISLVQRVPPSSRSEYLDSYVELENDLESAVEEINNYYGNDSWEPVKLLKEGVPQEKLVGEYRLADALWINSLEDGMNLVVKEGMVSQYSCIPVLLSKYAGASVELDPGDTGINPIIIDPRDIEDTSKQLKNAYKSAQKDLDKNWDEIIERIRNNSLESWAEALLKDGRAAHNEFRN